jgi:hypothetical protein
LNEKEEEDDINGDLQNVKESIIKVSEKIIGKKEYVWNEDWFDQDCKDAIAEKNKAWNKYLQRGTRQNKEECENKRKLATKICKVKRKE